MSGPTLVSRMGISPLPQRCQLCRGEFNEDDKYLIKDYGGRGTYKDRNTGCLKESMGNRYHHVNSLCLKKQGIALSDIIIPPDVKNNLEQEDLSKMSRNGVNIHDLLNHILQ